MEASIIQCNVMRPVSGLIGGELFERSKSLHGEKFMKVDNCNANAVNIFRGNATVIPENELVKPLGFLQIGQSS